MDVCSVKIAALVFDPANARKHSEKNLDAIKGSLTKFGQQKPIVVDAKNVVVAGNGTLAAARELGWTEIAAVRTELTGAEAIAFALADNRTAELAEWDDEILGKTLHALREIDFDLTGIGFDTSYLDKLARENGGGEDDAYTRKIEAPIYEPKGEKPPVESLVDLTKTASLLGEIEKSTVPPEVKIFLRYAAARHTVFDYEKIAEFYAHAEPAVQDLMERSALVIIDFEKAIEGGFVALSQEIAEAYKDAQQ